MRKIGSVLAAFALALCMLGGCAAAEPQEEPDTHSEAYACWQDAVAAGYVGDFLDFLKEFSASQSEEEYAGVHAALSSVLSVQCTFTLSAGFGREYEADVYGSGVIYSMDENGAYVITNYHVVYNRESNGRESVPHVSDKITLRMYGADGEGSGITAYFVNGAMDCDVALLRVSGTDRTEDGVRTNSEALKMGHAQAAVLAPSWAVAGERAYVIGNANGEGIAVMGGVISVEAEYISMASLDGLRTVSFLEIRTDAAVNHGNSGGGLFNSKGELLGISNARSEKSGVQSFYYALPSDFVRAVAESARTAALNGLSYTPCADWGVTWEEIESSAVWIEGRYVISETLSVKSVRENSPADGVLQTGDIIQSVTLPGGVRHIGRLHDLTITSFDIRTGDTVKVGILRDGAVREVELHFGAEDFMQFI